ncbi:hypothetical protein RRF57_002224 [Xylaria bambusicola]|uniref:Uncharacterized protein n=1 Tax=Xylaria bambusicola TaxID=326684 RepID=A0AAN7USF8_9PEZI
MYQSTARFEWEVHLFIPSLSTGLIKRTSFMQTSLSAFNERLVIYQITQQLDIFMSEVPWAEERQEEERKKKAYLCTNGDAYHHDAAKTGVSMADGDIGIIIGSDKMHLHETKTSRRSDNGEVWTCYWWHVNFHHPILPPSPPSRASKSRIQGQSRLACPHG